MDHSAQGENCAVKYQEMFLVVRSLKHGNDKVDYQIQNKDILKIGRVKFAVKEIGYEENAPDLMEVDSNSTTEKEQKGDAEEQGHVANSLMTKTIGDDFDEFEEVEAIVE